MDKPLDKTLHFRVETELYEALDKAKEEYGLEDLSTLARFILRKWAFDAEVAQFIWNKWKMQALKPIRRWSNEEATTRKKR